jgi:hypothetical protein|tara:strand:+ start:3775 stop:5409 length:1635 start_codon:yes stop_codon:yes gene_type:complete
MTTKKIVIVGAGISGLSCALELVERGYKVELYEASSTFGGQAKSVKTNTCYVPYAWRVWTNFYYNFLEIVSRVPYRDGTVRDNLVPLPNYSHELQKGAGRQVAGGETLDIKNFPSKASFLRLIMKIANSMVFSDERLQENDITFYDYMDPQDQATINWVDEFVGPILGMEARKATLFTVVKGWQVTYMSASLSNNFEQSDIYVANGPYSEVLFNPWVKHLMKQGVVIYPSTRVTSLNYDADCNKILSMNTDTQGRVYGDDFVLCIDQTSLNKLLVKNSDLMNIPMLKRSTKLMKYGNNLWFGMVLYFSEKFSPEIGTGCTQDQPWKIVLENFSASWRPEFVNKCGVAEIVQVTVLDLVPGLNGKVLHDCSVEEAVDETLKQLSQSKLMKTLRTKTGKSAWDTLVGFDIWPDWVNNEDGKIINRVGQYKLSINPHCWKNMPNIKTPVHNLYIGSVIAKADAPMVSMEFACTNGRSAANAICEKYGSKPVKVLQHKGYLPKLLAPLRGTEAMLYNLGIKCNVIVTTVLLVITITVSFIIFLLRRRR